MNHPVATATGWRFLEILLRLLFIKRWIYRIEISRLEIILHHAQCLAEALIVDYFPFTEEFDGVAYVGIVYESEQIIIGRACLLLCGNFKSATFEIGRAVK